MIIRCPYCEFSRSVSPDRIPSKSETATCPKCGQRFRFRTLEHLRKEPTSTLPSPEPSPPGQVQGQDLWDSLENFNREMKDKDLKSQENIIPEPEAPQSPKFQEAHEHEDYSDNPFQDEAPELENPIFYEEDTSINPQDNQISLDIPQDTPPPPQDPMEQARIIEEMIQRQKEKLHGTEKEGQSKNEAMPRLDDKLPELNVAPTNEALPRLDNKFSPEIEKKSFAPAENKSSSKRKKFTLAKFFSSRKKETENKDSDKDDIKALDEAINKVKNKNHIALHSYKDSPPEEKVEQDLLLLKGDESKPIRDIGFLRDNTEEEKEEAQKETEILWEHPDKFGWISSFFKTGKEVMFSAPSFFIKIPQGGSLSSSFLFFLLHGYFSILCIMLWSHVASIVLAIPSLGRFSTSLPAILLLAPLALGLLLILAAGSTRLTIQIIKGQQINFNHSCRILSYAVSPLLLSIIPFVGPIAGTLWFLVSIATGCRYAYSISWPKALLATLPTILILVGTIYFLV